MSRRGDIFHLHVVIDDELRKRLEAHAKRLHADDPHTKPNLSEAVRDLLRVSVGIPRAANEGVERDDDDERWSAPARAVP